MVEQVVRGRVDAGEAIGSGDCLWVCGEHAYIPVTYTLVDVLTTCYHKMRLTRKTALLRTMDIGHVRTHD